MADGKKYRVMYGMELVGMFTALKEAMESIQSHPKFIKSRYTRKGRPRSGHEDLKAFYIVDNNGDMYYIY